MINMMPYMMAVKTDTDAIGEECWLRTIVRMVLVRMASSDH